MRLDPDENLRRDDRIPSDRCGTDNDIRAIGN
jgi:hypothetical protein